MNWIRRSSVSIAGNRVLLNHACHRASSLFLDASVLKMNFSSPALKRIKIHESRGPVNSCNEAIMTENWSQSFMRAFRRDASTRMKKKKYSMHVKAYLERSH
ncbi:hypothetical protein GF325_06250 [Candidatus Bathyarchaeota archaeon]|nr:hypothetical protein [Candidatus Bathyarchaeota archaeon]